MKRYISLFVFAFLPFMLLSQNDVRNDVRKDFDEFRASMYDNFRNSRNEMMGNYQDFRSRIMREYVDFVRKAWEAFEGNEPEPLPKEEPLPPVVMPEEHRNVPVDDRPVPIKDILPPVEVVPQPRPIMPIENVPVVEEKRVDFCFFGTVAAVRFDMADKVILGVVNENAVADALEKMAVKSHDNMIADCLRIRDRLSLSDWAYINMLNALAKRIYGSDANSATLLMAYLYMQSGYKMRLAMDSGRLYMLYASRHYVYEQPCYVIDGTRYYCIEKLPLRMNICQAAFEQETPLSLVVASCQNLAFAPADTHHVASADYPGFDADIVVNGNLLEFYKTFPTSMIGDNMYTRWAMYANTPTDERVAAELYPALKSKLCGLSELEAAGRILNIVQTGFEYRYDDEVWGGDRIFFPDEALYYSYNDCDDRSVLFSRLVRDLLGLDACLVFTAGHVLVGVEFNEDVKGAYIMAGDRKFVLCEPTCTNGAPVGWSGMTEGADLNVYMLDR